MVEGQYEGSWEKNASLEAATEKGCDKSPTPQKNLKSWAALYPS